MNTSKSPRIDSCTKSADRYGDLDVVPARIAREIETENAKLRATLALMLRGDVDISPMEGGGWVVVDFRTNPPKSREYSSLEEATNSALANAGREPARSCNAKQQAGQRSALALASCSGLWALKSPDGKLVWQTLAEHHVECHGTPDETVWAGGGYSWVAKKEGEQWQAKTWKKWAESIASAKELGWRFVRVTLSEDFPNANGEPRSPKN